MRAARCPACVREQSTPGEVVKRVTPSLVMRRLAILAALVVLLGLAPAATRADEPRATIRTEAPLPQLDDDADPIGEGGLDALAEAEAHARRERALRGPPPPDLPVREGEALTAPSGVREAAHEVDVTLDDGLAVATHTLRFTSTARTPAELRYRLAVPVGAWLGGLEVCDASGCRVGDVRGDAGGAAYDDAVRARRAENARGPLAVAHAQLAHDARGDAIVVRAAPVHAGEELTLRVRWVAQAAIHRGIARIVLPARGQDPRAAAARVTVHAPRMLAATADGLTTDETPVTVEPWFTTELAATMPSGAPLTATAWRTRCGAQSCARVRVAAGTRAGTPMEIVLLIDASPSTLGPARGRLEPAIAALLGSAPPGSRVRAVAFGGRAEMVFAESVETASAPLVPLAQAAQTELGSATRIETAWQIVEPWLSANGRALPPLIVLIGDGGLSEGADTERALTEIVASRVPFSVIDIGERAPVVRLRETALRSGGVVVHAPPRDAEAAKLEERIAEVFAPIVAHDVVIHDGPRVVHLGALRAGEERSWTHADASGAVRVSAARVTATARNAAEPLAAALALGLAADDAPHALAAVALPVGLRGVRGSAPAVCLPYGPATHPSGVSSDLAPVALAEPRSCRTAANEAEAREPGELRDVRPSNPLDGRGVPAETLLAMLRTRVVPAARACFRADRAGRADYSVRAGIAFTLADREILSTDITGELAPALRSCLLDAVERLEVPRFEGTVVVRYPVYTEAAPPAPTIELSGGAARGVDSTFGRGVRVEDVRALRR